MKATLFVVDSFEDVVDVFMHYSHSVETFFCSGSAEFVVIIEVYDGYIKVIETSVGAKFVSSGGCGIISKFYTR